MSGEIGEACQVVMITGKLITRVMDLTVEAAVLSARTANMIYMSKWKGRTQFRRLLNIKGEQNGLVFLNVSAEPDSGRNKRAIRGIEKELKAHGILFSRMPDLCGGDGNTQYCVSASDAKKVSAMLVSHMNGKYRHVAVAEISEADYTMTGRRADGTPTPELHSIEESARQELEKQDKPHRGRVIPFTTQEHARAETAEPKDITKLPAKIARQIAREHDLQAVMGEGSYEWLKSKPLVSKKIGGKMYHLLTLPDGENGIIVPDQDYRKEKYTSGGNSYRFSNYGALVSEDRQYYSVNYASGAVRKMTGTETLTQARKEPVYGYYLRVSQLLENAKQKEMLLESVARTIKAR